MMRLSIPVLALLLPMAASAQIAPDSPLVQALREGRATAPLPPSQHTERVVRHIREASGSQGDITVEFVRVARFVAQPKCGRVGYGLYQKSSNTFWGQFGGQVNICEDGTPPQRECKGTPGLVAPDASCPDGTAPVDTAEVKAAIAHALAGGGLTAEQFRARYQAARKTSGSGH
jgi:hypothetical protein